RAGLANGQRRHRGRRYDGRLAAEHHDRRRDSEPLRAWPDGANDVLRDRPRRRGLRRGRVRLRRRDLRPARLAAAVEHLAPDGRATCGREILTARPGSLTASSPIRNRPLLASPAPPSAGVRKGAAMRILAALALATAALAVPTAAWAYGSEV